jgi:hypothetical protein
MVVVVFLFRVAHVLVLIEVLEGIDYPCCPVSAVGEEGLPSTFKLDQGWGMDV